MSARAVPLLFLDLDGTVREGKDDALGRFVNGPEDVVVFPEAKIMMRRWKDAGGRIVAVTNQGGIALGIVTTAQVHAALWETQKQCDDMFDRIVMCSHHPNAQNLDDARCWCRKPLPGMIFDSVYDLTHLLGEYYPPYMALMVGDRPEDEACANAADIEFQWAADWRALAGVVG